METFAENLIGQYGCFIPTVCKHKFIYEKMVCELKKIQKEINKNSYSDICQFVKQNIYRIRNILMPFNDNVNTNVYYIGEVDNALVKKVVDFIIVSLGLPFANNWQEPECIVSLPFTFRDNYFMRNYKREVQILESDILDQHVESLIDEFLAINKDFVDTGKIAEFIKYTYSKFFTEENIQVLCKKFNRDDEEEEYEEAEDDEDDEEDDEEYEEEEEEEKSQEEIKVEKEVEELLWDVKYILFCCNRIFNEKTHRRIYINYFENTDIEEYIWDFIREYTFSRN